MPGKNKNKNKNICHSCGARIQFNSNVRLNPNVLKCKYCDAEIKLEDISQKDDPVLFDNIPEKASVNGKYFDLLQVLECERARKKYGSYHDYGYWGGGPWCGSYGKAGYRVWVAPE